MLVVRALLPEAAAIDDGSSTIFKADRRFALAHNCRISIGYRIDAIDK